MWSKHALLSRLEYSVCRYLTGTTDTGTTGTAGGLEMSGVSDVSADDEIREFDDVPPEDNLGEKPNLLTENASSGATRSERDSLRPT
jgi:hypothetical protein